LAAPDDGIEDLGRYIAPKVAAVESPDRPQRDRRHRLAVDDRLQAQVGQDEADRLVDLPAAHLAPRRHLLGHAPGGAAQLAGIAQFPPGPRRVARPDGTLAQ
jgi:hypothetical protein